MPYIKKDNRKDIQTNIDKIPITSIGSLNYTITYLLHKYLRHVGLKYDNINSVIGILECAKLELYRQIANPYEDIKKEKNGNISSLDKE